MSEQHNFRQRKPRNRPSNNPDPASKKPTIISDILATNDNPISSTNKKKHFSSATFRGLGCTASPRVSVPSVIRTSASWEPTTNTNTTSNDKVKKKKFKTKKINSINSSSSNNNNYKYGSFPANNGVTGVASQSSSLSLALSSSCVGVPDVWCGPGIGLTTDAASVDCVVSAPRHGRPKVDGIEKTVLGHRERSCPVRRMVAPEDIHFLESEAALVMPRYVSGSRNHRHVRNNNFRDGLAEILMLRGDLRMGERSSRLDVYRDMRLDVDNMSYEELLELGDRIGYVSTGLGENEISCCLRRTKLANFEDLSSHIASETERKCSICQEEYETDDEMGKLHCGHFFHIDCIKHWLSQKNICPICKTEAVSQI